MKISQHIKDKITDLLKWDIDRYEKFVFECGIAFLYAYIKAESDEIINEIRRSQIFWNWWKQQWQQRDEQFIDSITSEIKKDIARQLYQLQHDPATLAAALHPNGVVLGESYAKMIDEFNKKGVAA